jgi:hypothetical protein
LSTRDGWRRFWHAVLHGVSDHTPQQPPVRWLSASESPFGVSVLDCRPMTQNRVAASGSAEIAARFAQLRTWLGEELSEQQLSTEVPVPGHLRYPSYGKEQPDGPVFKATAMEEKWDLYMRAGRLYFVRSWTGEVEYAVQVSWGPQEWVITQAWQAATVDDDVRSSMQVIDYLIKCHLYNLAAPHPLQVAFRGDDERLALASFADYGWRALYGTFDDLIGCAALEKKLWGSESAAS